MLLFLLAMVVLALAAVLWHTQASDAEKPILPPEDAGLRLRKALAANPRKMEALAAAIRALAAVMAHPELGGPGFLMVQFPSQAAAVVTVQYPNIREELYRRIVRQELARDELAAAGVPEDLLDQGPGFETESGGVVLISVQAGEPLPELSESLNSRKDRNAALNVFAELLEERFPEFSVRIFGTDLLLTPIHEKQNEAVTSKSE